MFVCSAVRVIRTHRQTDGVKTPHVSDVSGVMRGKAFEMTMKRFFIQWPWPLTLTYKLDILPLDLYKCQNSSQFKIQAGRVRQTDGRTHRQCQNYYTHHIRDVGCKNLATCNLVRMWTLMALRLTLNVKIIGQRKSSPGKMWFQVSLILTVLQGNVRGQGSHGSRSNVTWVKVKGYKFTGQSHKSPKVVEIASISPIYFHKTDAMGLFFKY